jgi:Na+/H+ antiporter NhaD/arsenite permease-like protein
MEYRAELASTWEIYTAIVIFLLAYGLIITERLNRALIAMVGGIMMVLFHFVRFEDAYRKHIEWDMILLLIGMMILVGITNKTGVFQYIAIKAAQLAKGNPIRILIILSVLTAVGSSFLDNVTTVLLVVPITFLITRMLKVNPVPFLISEILASNIGGTATLIGDPPNIMIGAANPHLTFNAFLTNLGPVVVIILVVTMWIVYSIYHRQMETNAERQAELMKLNPADFIKDRTLMIKSVGVLLLTIFGFMLHSMLQVEAAMIALAGASLLMLLGVKDRDMEEVFYSVEWVTIFFFGGLFVLVAGLINVGVIGYLAEKAIEWTDGNIPHTSLLVLWVSGIASATIDNIPFVATMIPLIKNMGLAMGLTAESALMDPIWWSLALGACLGGNGTLIGASANVIVAGMAVKEGKGFTYLEFLKIGAPITFISLIIATVYVYFVYLVKLM